MHGFEQFVTSKEFNQLSDMLSGMTKGFLENMSEEEKHNMMDQFNPMMFAGMKRNGGRCGRGKERKEARKEARKEERSASRNGANVKMNGDAYGYKNCKCDSINKNQENVKPMHEIKVPMKDFKPSTININLNKQGLMTISGTSEKEFETNRNGMRRTTVIMEETVQLPFYLIEDDSVEKVDSKSTNDVSNVSEPVSQSKPKDKSNESDHSESIDTDAVMIEVDRTSYTCNNETTKNQPKSTDQKESTDMITTENNNENKVNLLSQVETKFDNGFLFIRYPQKPVVLEEKPKVKVDESGPMEIEIEFV